MTREIKGLRQVRLLQERPECIPQGRPRGAKAQGVKYEEALANLPGFAWASHGAWFEFDDASGHGYAQVDFLFGGDGWQPVVAEAKLTWTPTAYQQLRKLYFPLLRRLLGIDVGGMVICQNLTKETPKSDVVGSLAEAFSAVAFGRIPVLHLPLLLKEPRHGVRTNPRLPPWWRKGQASPRTGHPSGG